MTTIRRSPLRTATVTAATTLTPRMRRVTLTSPEFVNLPVNPAQDAELLLSEPSGRRIKRRYTIRYARPSIGEWDLDVLVHGHGPGSEWAATTRLGDEVSLYGPRGRLALTDVAWQLFVGDESSLPAFAALAEVTAPGTAVHAFIEVDSADDELALTAPAGAEVETTWIHRGLDGEAGTPDLLRPVLDKFVSDKFASGGRSGPGHAYLLGESRSVVTLRQALSEVLAPEQIFTKGYWNRVGPRPAGVGQAHG